MSNPPLKIHLRTQSGTLALAYPDGNYELSFEFLRVHSPSAEVRGHGIGNEVLQTGKKHVVLTHIEPVGNYGIKLVFNDGHDSGIYTWPLLHELCMQKGTLWQRYLEKLDAAGASRTPTSQ